MGITVDAEAVADEPASYEIVKTGDDSNMIIWLLLGISAAAILMIAGRKRNADKDI